MVWKRHRRAKEDPTDSSKDPQKFYMLWLHTLCDQNTTSEQLEQSRLEKDVCQHLHPHRLEWIYPESDLIPIQCYDGVAKRGWHDLDRNWHEMGFEGNADQVKQSMKDYCRAPGLSSSVGKIHSIIQNLVDGTAPADRTGDQSSIGKQRNAIPLSRIFLGGFSQGGALAMLAGLSYKSSSGQCLAGVISVSGYLITDINECVIRSNILINPTETYHSLKTSDESKGAKAAHAAGAHIIQKPQNVRKTLWDNPFGYNKDGDKDSSVVGDGNLIATTKTAYGVEASHLDGTTKFGFTMPLSISEDSKHIPILWLHGNRDNCLPVDEVVIKHGIHHLKNTFKMEHVEFHQVDMMHHSMKLSGTENQDLHNSVRDFIKGCCELISPTYNSGSGSLLQPMSQNGSEVLKLAIEQSMSNTNNKNDRPMSAGGKKQYGHEKRHAGTMNGVSNGTSSQVVQ